MNWSLNIIIIIVGLIIVFGSLLLLSLVISLYPKIIIKQNKKPIKTSIISNVEDFIDEEIISVITAAIAEELSTESDRKYSSHIVVRKIRRVNGGDPIWNTTGRMESIFKNIPGGV